MLGSLFRQSYDIIQAKHSTIKYSLESQEEFLLRLVFWQQFEATQRLIQSGKKVLKQVLT